MFGFLKSDSRKRADEDKEYFFSQGYEHFKRSVHQATDNMLRYEMYRYMRAGDAFAMAFASRQQMIDSGGEPWVTWLNEKCLVEMGYVKNELGRRGYSEGFWMSDVPRQDCIIHSWELLDIEESALEPYQKQCMEAWGF